MNNILSKQFILVLIAFFTLLFTSFFPFNSEPKYIKLKNRIVGDYAKQLRKENGLYLAGGGGALMHNVKEISLMFACYQKMSVPEARNLYVKIIEGYLQRINQNEAIRPYLDQYPFQWNNMDVQIMFQDTNNLFPKEGVAIVILGKANQIVYCGYDGKDLYDIHRETQEEAIKLANASASQITIR